MAAHVRRSPQWWLPVVGSALGVACASAPSVRDDARADAIALDSATALLRIESRVMPGLPERIDTTIFVLETNYAPIIGIPHLRTPSRSDVGNKRVVYAGQLGGERITPSSHTNGRIVVLAAPARPDGDGPDYQLWQYAGALAEFRDAAALLVITLDLTPPGALDRARLIAAPGVTPAALPPMAAISRSTASRLMQKSISITAPGDTGNKATFKYRTRYRTR